MFGDGEKMSAYNELQPHFNAYQGEIRKAKNASGKTLPEIAEQSGVPYNNVCDINAGRCKQPALYYAAALCKVFGLSLNRLMGLDEPADGQAEMQQHVHQLELEVSELKGEVGRMSEVKSADEREKAQLNKELSARKPVIYILLFLCTILVVSLGYYLVVDFHLTDAGLVLFGQITIYAAALILVMFVSLSAILYIAAREIRLGLKGKK